MSRLTHGPGCVKAPTIWATFNGLNASHAPSGYNYHKTNDYIIFHEIVYDEESGFPRVEKSIKIHKTLLVHLQFRGNDVPLPQ